MIVTNILIGMYIYIYIKSMITNDGNKKFWKLKMLGRYLKKHEDSNKGYEWHTILEYLSKKTSAFSCTNNKFDFFMK